MFPDHALSELNLVPAKYEVLPANLVDLLQVNRLAVVLVAICHRALVFEVRSTLQAALRFELLVEVLIGLPNS
jgi:hypothetical protein